MDKKIKTAELFSMQMPYITPLFTKSEYPWEIVAGIKEYIAEMLENPPEGFSLLKDGVLIGKDVKISPFATVEKPCVLGAGTELRPGAYIRGNVITGECCVIGNSSELKNCVLLSHVQVPHYNYVGDSVLGFGVHMGAGAICSNLKSDGKAVLVHADVDYATGMRKLGAILGDGAEIGCGCVLNPGTVVGKGTRIYPLNSVRGVIGEGLIVKSAADIAKAEEQS